MTALAIIPYQQIPVIDLGRPAGSISQHGCDLSGPFQTRSLCTLVIFFFGFWRWSFDKWALSWTRWEMNHTNAVLDTRGAL